MTAYDITQKALKLLGYTSASGNEQLTARLMNRAIELINTVYEDLWGIVYDIDFTPVATLDDEIGLTAKALGVMPYGVAAFMAQSESDGDSQQLWMTAYRQRRLKLTAHHSRKDVIPRCPDL